MRVSDQSDGDSRNTSDWRGALEEVWLRNATESGNSVEVGEFWLRLAEEVLKQYPVVEKWTDGEVGNQCMGVGIRSKDG